MKNNWKKRGLILKPKKKDGFSHAVLPKGIILENKIRLFFSKRDYLNRSHPFYVDVDINDPKKIIYSRTKPILKLGDAGTFDESGIMPTCIKKVFGKYFLYYIGYSLSGNVPYKNSIGLAVSDDCKSFKKYSRASIFKTTNKEPFFTASLDLIQYKKKLHSLYLSGVKWENIDSKYEPIYDLKYGSSLNGIDWKRNGDVAINLKSKEEGGIASPSILKIKNTFYLWYSYRSKYNFRSNKDNSYRIGFAFSNDLKNWKRKDNQFNLDISGAGWDSEMMAYPNVLQIEKKLIMFYNGNSFGKSGIGYAENEI